MNIKKIGYIILGTIGLILGGVGAVIPLIPCVPFLLLAVYGFARSSERVHTWFIGTKIYKENLENYVEKKGMKKNEKIRIISIVTLTMAIGFFMMSDILIGRICIAIVWIIHLIYLGCIVKTI